MEHFNYRKNDIGIKIKKEMYQYLLHEINESSTAYNQFITLSTNFDYKISAIQDKVRNWHYRINCRVFKSSRFHNNNDIPSKKYDNCFKYWGFLEYTKGGMPHYHLLAYVHPERIDYFKRVAPHFWVKSVKQGSVDIQDITEDKSKIVSYVTKKVNSPLGFENYIIS